MAKVIRRVVVARAIRTTTKVVVTRPVKVRVQLQLKPTRCPR